VEFNYNLEDIDTSSVDKTCEEVVSLGEKYFQESNSSDIKHIFKRFSDLYEGRDLDYQGIDVAYHDLEHTLQVTMCMARLVTNRHNDDTDFSLSGHQYDLCIASALMHDLGYLKLEGDLVGTGAKYTFVHEQRGCQMAELELRDLEWGKGDIELLQNMIMCTGPRASIDKIPFRDEMGLFLGRALCTADYIGQMSDYRYIQKLPGLFLEFQESDHYRSISEVDRMFNSAEDLFTKTPDFWNFIFGAKLQQECNNVYDYLAVPYPDGPNHYLEEVEANIANARTIVKEGQVEAFIKKYSPKSA
jgi:hypothetical protein